MLTTVLTEASEEVLLEDDELHGDEDEIFKLEAMADDDAAAPPDDVASSSSRASSSRDVSSCSTLLIRTVCSPTSSSLLPASVLDGLVVDFQNLSGSTWCTGDSGPTWCTEVEGGGIITTVDVVDVVWFVLKSKADDEVGLLTLPII